MHLSALGRFHVTVKFLPVKVSLRSVRAPGVTEESPEGGQGVEVRGLGVLSRFKHSSFPSLVLPCRVSASGFV